MKKSTFVIEIPTDGGLLLFNTINVGLVPHQIPSALWTVS